MATPLEIECAIAKAAAEVNANEKDLELVRTGVKSGNNSMPARIYAQDAGRPGYQPRHAKKLLPVGSSNAKDPPATLVGADCDLFFFVLLLWNRLFAVSYKTSICLRLPMKVEISASFFYEAWTVSSDFGTSTSYRIYMKVLDPGRGIPGQQDYRPANLFANKHLGQDAETILRMRSFQGVSEAGKWDAMEKLGVRLKMDLSPKNAPHTNTVIDFRKIDRKNAAYLIAKALFEGMLSGKFGDFQNTKENGYIDQFDVEDAKTGDRSNIRAFY